MLQTNHDCRSRGPLFFHKKKNVAVAAASKPLPFGIIPEDWLRLAAGTLPYDFLCVLSETSYVIGGPVRRRV